MRYLGGKIRIECEAEVVQHNDFGSVIVKLDSGDRCGVGCCMLDEHATIIREEGWYPVTSEGWVSPECRYWDSRRGKWILCPNSLADLSQDYKVIGPRIAMPDDQED